MVKSLYYIECTCIKDCHFPNVSFHVGDVFYYNKKAASNEMYIFNPHIHPESNIVKEAKKYTFGSYLPFTRQKRFAKKWEIKRYPDWEAMLINEKGEFNAVVKEIKVTYEEEEV